AVASGDKAGWNHGLPSVPRDGGRLILETEHGARTQARRRYQPTRAAGKLRYVRAAAMDVGRTGGDVRRVGRLRSGRRVGQRLGPCRRNGCDGADRDSAVRVPLVGALSFWGKEVAKEQAMQELDQMTKEERLERMRHSAAHIMAEAVCEMFPDASLGIGPPIDTGFYYDFELPRTLTLEDL